MRVATGGPGFDAIKPRIFQIGFNKCGTRSFYDFFEKNGIKSVHFKRGDLARGIDANLQAGKPPLEGWDKWTGYTDMQSVQKTGVIEACAFYRSFAAYYPRSYFILNTRSKDRWIKSRLNHGTTQNYSKRYCMGMGLNSIEETVAAWSEMWDKHHEEVPAFFAKTGQHFLTYNIEEDTPDKLQAFLAPDFKTDARHFGHQGKTDPKAADNAPAKKTMGYERPAPIVVKSVPKAPAPADVDPQLGARLTPRNDIVSFDEAVVRAPYEAAPVAPPAAGSSGNLIVANLGNDAPFLLEWIAHHQAIGVHHFLIYTPNSTDQTGTMLDRLAELGLVTHATDTAFADVMAHPKVFESDWVIHIDCDEFINVRTGNGTFACLLDALPEAVSNIAMTGRIFGSAGVRAYDDRPILAQFDRCAPAYLPKPHTCWGFKTATRNIGAYQTLSAHRPGTLNESFEAEVAWVNGSGKDITKARAQRGWRSDVSTIGYDLVQLNRYPLRAFAADLASRAPSDGTGTDADRWLRLDWNSHSDVTIQRNLPRMRAALAHLKDDPALADLHSAAVAEFQSRAAQLAATAEAGDLAQDISDMPTQDAARVRAILDLDQQARDTQK